VRGGGGAAARGCRAEEAQGARRLRHRELDPEGRGADAEERARWRRRIRAGQRPGRPRRPPQARPEWRRCWRRSGGSVAQIRHRSDWIQAWRRPIYNRGRRIDADDARFELGEELLLLHKLVRKEKKVGRAWCSGCCPWEWSSLLPGAAQRKKAWEATGKDQTFGSGTMLK
jgi:hypothetical protein